MKQWKRGDKAEALIGNHKVPAIVIESGVAVHGLGYGNARLRIATYSPLHDRWFPSVHPKPVSYDKLTMREGLIPGLDPDYSKDELVSLKNREMGQ